MKGYEFIKAIQEKKIDSNTKFKVTNMNRALDTKVRFDGVDIVFYDSGINIFNYYFLTTILNADFEVIEEDKEIEELEISKKDRKMHSDYINNIVDKLNEVINKLNKEREEK